MQTFAQELGITEFPYQLFDKNEHLVYDESSNGCWFKKVFDNEGNQIHYSSSNGFWWKREYDVNHKVLVYKESNGFWYKQIFNDDGIRVYFENSDGKIIGNKKTRDELVEEIWNAMLVKLDAESQKRELHYQNIIDNIPDANTNSLEDLIKAFERPDVEDHSYLMDLSPLPDSLQMRVLEKMVGYKEAHKPFIPPLSTEEKKVEGSLIQDLILQFNKEN